MKLDLRKAIGCIYISTIEDVKSKSFQQFRCIGIQNDHTVRLKNTSTEKTIKVDIEELKREYVLLEPDGYIFINSVTMAKESTSPLTEDVMVSFFRRIDLESPTLVPFCVCRQNINNMFDVIKNEHTKTVDLVGCCVSQETIPEGVNFMSMLSCEAVLETAVISVYFTDSLDTITSYKCVRSFDKKLASIEEAFVLFKKEKNPTATFEGYQRTVKELLAFNEFIYDQKRGFGITTLDFIIVLSDLSESKLSPKSLERIEELFQFKLSGHLVIEYDRDIDIELIRGSKIFVCDKWDHYYIISYTNADDSLGTNPALPFSFN